VTGGYYDERGYDGRRDYEIYGDYGAGYGRGDVGRPAKKVDPFAGEMEAFGRLFSSYLTHPRVKFLAVNTDPATSAPTVVNKLLQSPWPWAHVMAARSTGPVAQYAGMDCKQPTLAIVDTTGTIKYAGPAAGFLAPMMLRHIAGEPSSGGSARRPGGTGGPATMFNPFKGLFGDASRRRPTGTGRTTTPPKTTAGGTTPPPGRTEEDDGDITPEEYQAAKLLEFAKMYVSAGRQPVLRSKRGIDLCRQIIRDYPNTRYAQEARMLLRRVPEYERKRYNITNKEMGL